MTDEEEKKIREDRMFSAILNLLDICEDVGVENLETFIVGSSKSYFISIKADEPKESGSVH